MILKLTGLEEIKKKLKQLEQKDAKRIMNASIKKGSAPMLDAAQETAPIETGQLKNAIKLKAIRSKKSFGIKLEIGEKMFVGKTFYGAFQEFGTKFMEGEHFLEKAFKAHENEVKENIINEATKRLDKWAKKKGIIWEGEE